MWLEAILTKQDVWNLALQFAPLNLRLGEHSELQIDTPVEVSLVPDNGIEIRCSGKVHWPLLGITVPATLRSIVIRITPRVEKREGQRALVFGLQLERIDVVHLPALFDHRLAARVNEELSAKHIELAWKFADTLSHVFDLPDALASSATLGLHVDAGAVKITDSALAFAVSYHSEATRRVAAGPPADRLHNGHAAPK
jgi:hypothetical protein